MPVDESVTSRAEAFTRIYREHSWSGGSRSGRGSDPEATVAYRRLLAQFLAEHRVTTVVDLGCGDWASSRLVDWRGVRYLGVDAVADAVAANRAAYGSEAIRFECADIVDYEPPQADLCLCKDVLQHLPDEDVRAVLARLPRFRWALLTNDVLHERRAGWRGLWRWRAVPLVGAIAAGGYRTLDLRSPPWSLPARVVLRYSHAHEELRWTKEVLLWSRDAAPA